MSLPFQKIHHVIDKFYEKAKTDILIGFHFRDIDDFDEHIKHIALFWEFQLNGKISTPLKKPFNMFEAHLKLKINLGQLNRWIVLFYQTLDEENIEENTQQEWKAKVEFFKDIFIRKILVS
jgi:truncated hemoglobin YjbI